MNSQAASQEDALVRAESLSIAYEPGRPVLRDVDLTIAAGRSVGVMVTKAALHRICRHIVAWIL